MKTLFIYLTIFFMIPVQEQEMKVNPQKTELTIYGTSSIHDWEIEASKCTGTAAVEFNQQQFVTINKLDFKVEVAALESGKSAMDDNTVKALKGDKFPYITYELVEIKPHTDGSSNTVFDTKGKLTIAGTTNLVNMKTTIQQINSGLQISGELNIKMTDFQVDPPTAIFGTITTGDDIKINFKTTYIH